MALQNDTSRIQYNGNNSTSNSYAIPFVFFENSHIKCVVTTSAGADTELTLGSTFNVTGAGNANGGSLTTTTAVPASSKVTIFRNVPATQTTSYQEGGDFPAASHERALDKLTMIAQQTKRLADRALKVPETQNNPNDLPNAGTGQKLLGSNNGTLTWEENRQLPSYPATAGTQALVTAGSGATPSWQTMPNIAIGPVTATGSTTARFVSDRFAETVKVADFGAIGNGVADDAAAIQAAITYAISRGNAVIEFEPKTYNLVSFKANTGGTVFPLLSNRNHLEIHGGTSFTKLIFKGNGAVLYVNQTDTDNPAYLFAITTDFDCIDFDNFTFERKPFTTNYPLPVSGSAFIAMRPVSTNTSNRFSCKNVSFVNGFSAIIDNRGYSVSKTYKHLKLVEWINCKHLHTRGSNGTNPAGGGQMLNLSGWVDHFVADGVYADGAVGGVIPNDVSYPVDGWLYVSPYRTSVSNSMFKNMWVEGIICEQPPCDIININAFVQPAIGATVTVTVRPDQSNWNETLVAGKLYSIRDKLNPPSWKPWSTGVYRVDSWQTPIAANSTITLTRMSDQYAVRPDTAFASIGQFPAQGATSSSDCALVLFEEGGPASASIVNCHFDMDAPIKRQNGSSKLFNIKVTNQGSGYTSAPTVTISGGQGATATAVVSSGNVVGINVAGGTFYYTTPPTVSIAGGGGNGATAKAKFLDQRFKPCIVARSATMISNCTFRNFGNALIIEPTNNCSYSGPCIVQGCVFYGQRSPVDGVETSSSHMVFVVTADTILSNNVFLQEGQNDYAGPILAGRSGLTITNNNFRMQLPATPGAGKAAITTLDSQANATWQMNISNNMFFGFNHAVRGNVPTVVGEVVGEFINDVTSFALGSPTGTQRKWADPSGKLWNLGITNNGVLEVSQ